MAVYNHQYVSTVSYLHQRELLNKALDIHEVEWNFMDFMELMGREELTAATKYTSYVNEDVYALGTCAGTVSGTSVTLALSDAAASSVIIGSLCFDHQNPAKIGYVQNVSSNNLTVISVDGTSMTFTSGKLVSFYSNASGEGSGSPEGKRYKLIPYTNQVQIFKGGSAKITDVSKVSKIEVEYGGDYFYFIKAQHDALMKHRSDIAFGLMYNQKAGDFDSPGALVDANGNAVQLTGGLDEYIVDRGIDQTLQSSGVVDVEEFRILQKQLDLRRAPSEFLVLASSDKNIALDDLWNAMETTPVLDNARFTVGQGRHLEMGVDSWKIYNRLYHKKWLPMMDAQNVTNFTDAPIALNAVYFLPYGKIKVDASGDMVDRFRIRYMAGDGTDTKYTEILTGGLAPTPTNNEQYLEIAYSSMLGLECLGVEHFAKMSDPS